MGPDAEYLEGKFAASGEPADIPARLQRALDRWETIRKSKGYANTPVPATKWARPANAKGELVLRVNSRDLPRGNGDRSGARRHELPPNGMWMDFIKWAWNENWLGIPSSGALVPSGSGWEPVSPGVARLIAREALIDNVRGQTPNWSDGEVKLADLKMRVSNSSKGEDLFEYSGKFLLQSGNRKFDATLYGVGRFVPNAKKFVSLDLVVVGMRSGAAVFNQRENDPGPAPMGVTLSLSLE